MRVFTDHRFDVSCRQDPYWMGAGEYDRTSTGIRLSFKALTRRGEVLRDKPSPIDLAIAGRGNSMTLSLPNGGDYVWQRVRL
jgi:hypothetical protein